ncbi:MAG: hypothetical protein ABI851_15595 [Saprospiraceae bacterium]
MKFNFLYLIIPAAILACLYIFKDLQGQSEYSFFGTAESDPRVLNLDVDVTVDQILVTAGTYVRIGDTLAILNRMEYDRDSINFKENYFLEETNVQNRQSLLLKEQELINVQQRAEVEKLRAEIAGLKYKDSLDFAYRNLIYSDMKNYSSINSTRISSLEKQISELNELKIRKLATLNEEARASNLLSDIKNKQRASIYKFNRTSKQKLVLIAPIDGYIDQIAISANGSFPAFKDILRINPKRPTRVLGFIHESSNVPFIIGDSVLLTSGVRSNLIYPGKIISVSPKLVELPLRLRKFIEIRSWGREVYIQIPDTTNFYIGERISIAINSAR